MGRENPTSRLALKLREIEGDLVADPLGPGRQLSDRRVNSDAASSTGRPVLSSGIAKIPTGHGHRLPPRKASTTTDRSEHEAATITRPRSGAWRKDPVARI
jgi:hypothetical protein